MEKDTLFNTGEFYFGDGDYENAYKYFLEAALKDHSSEALLYLGTLYLWGKYPRRDWDKAFRYFKDYFEETHSLAMLVVFDKKAFELSGNLIDNIREYVDSNYVESVSKEEYGYYSSGVPEESIRKMLRERRMLEEETLSLGSITLGEITTKPTGSAKKQKIKDLIDSSDV